MSGFFALKETSGYISSLEKNCSAIFLFCCWVFVVWFICFFKKNFSFGYCMIPEKFYTIPWLPHNSNINSSFSWSHPIGWAAVHCSHCGRVLYPEVYPFFWGLYCLLKVALYCSHDRRFISVAKQISQAIKEDKNESENKSSVWL